MVRVQDNCVVDIEALLKLAKLGGGGGDTRGLGVGFFVRRDLRRRV